MRSDAGASAAGNGGSVEARKHALRAELRLKRREQVAQQRSDQNRAAAYAVQIEAQAERLAWWAMVRGAGVAAAYASYGDEPPTIALLDALRASSLRVLLPVMREDGDLDWAPTAASTDLAPNARGIDEPTGVRYGPHALGGVDLVVVPALAVDADGYRLGQGAGFYDRALPRLRPDVPIIALLHDGELLPAGSVPHDTHDVPVTHVCTPSGGLVAVGTHRDDAPGQEPTT